MLSPALSTSDVGSCESKTSSSPIHQPSSPVRSPSSSPPLCSPSVSLSDSSSVSSSVTHLNPILDTNLSNPSSSSSLDKVGYVLYVEKLMGSDTIVWSEEKFFRLSDTPKAFKPLTPLLFSTSLSEGRTVGRFAAPSFQGSFTKILFDVSTPFVKGLFSRKGSDKIIFSFNPNGLLTHPSLATFPSHSFSGVVYDTDVLVQFSIRPPRYSSDTPFPCIKCVKSSIGTSVPLIEPVNNILPSSFIQDLAENPVFNFLLGIGIPENPYLPSLTFQEFCEFKDNGPLIWKRLHSVFVDKYKKLSSSESDKSSINNLFYNRLIKHGNNESKSILVFSGRWSNFSAISFSQSLIPTTKLSVYTLNFAHPLTNIPNAVEMNPLFSGSLGESNYSDKHFFPVPICLGEEGIDGETHFGFTHNLFYFLLCKVKLNDKFAKDASCMFHPFTHTQLKFYSSPEAKETGSEIEDHFILASFLRGVKGVEVVAHSGLFHHKLLDAANAWNVFDVYQLYSPHFSVRRYC